MRAKCVSMSSAYNCPASVAAGCCAPSLMAGMSPVITPIDSAAG
jgi:hypothetical protein